MKWFEARVYLAVEMRDEALPLEALARALGARGKVQE